MNYLVCTADDREYLKYDKVILLHSGSLTHKQKKELETKGVEIQILPDILLDKEKVLANIEYVNSVFNKMMKFVTEYLNNLHHENHDDHFWNLAFGRYIYNAINLYYVRYLELKQASEMLPKSFTCIVVDEYRNDRFWPTTYDKNNSSDQGMACYYADLLESIDFDLSYNIERLEDAVGKDFRPLPQRFYGDLDSSVIDFFKYIKRALIESFFDSTNNTNIVINAPYIIDRKELFKLFAGSRRKIGLWRGRNKDFLYEVCFKHHDFNVYDRPIKGFEKTDDVFLNFLYKKIIYFIPMPFIEGYKDLKKALLPYYSMCNCSVAVSAGQYFYNNSYNLWTALMNEKGTKVYAYQHGGRYGQCVDQQLHELITYDRFYLWGKSTPAEIYHSGIAVKLLGRKKWSYNVKYSKVILFCMGTKFRYMRSAYDSQAIHKKEYVKNEVTFAEGINLDKWKLVLREYMYDRGIEKLSDYLGHSNKYVWQDSKTVDLDNALSTCGLVVCDNLNTVVLEAWGLGIPTILVDDLEGAILYDDFKSELKVLMEVGLYFDDASQASSYINEIKDIYEWWMDVTRQTVLKDFCQKYIYIPTKWKSIYVDNILD